jgi:ABC-type proline/glycine betaine transport system permease subunit
VFLIPGYLAGLLAGAGLAILFILLPSAASVAMPVAIALRSVPIVTTAPLVVLLLGRGATSTIVLVAIMVFFPTFVACLHGLRQAPGQILDVFDSYAAGRVTQLVRVRIPAMLPAFFAAARMAVPASVLAVTVVEWLGTGRGIGSLMAMSASLSDYDMLWSAVVIVSVLSASATPPSARSSGGCCGPTRRSNLGEARRLRHPGRHHHTDRAVTSTNAGCSRGCAPRGGTCATSGWPRPSPTRRQRTWPRRLRSSRRWSPRAR